MVGYHMNGRSGQQVVQTGAEQEEQEEGNADAQVDVWPLHRHIDDPVLPSSSANIFESRFLRILAHPATDI
jgi:hypothetical protein